MELGSSAIENKAYTSRDHRCGCLASYYLYIESKTLIYRRKIAGLRNCFSNAAIGKTQLLEIRSRGRAKCNYCERNPCYSAGEHIHNLNSSTYTFGIMVPDHDRAIILHIQNDHPHSGQSLALAHSGYDASRCTRVTL